MKTDCNTMNPTLYFLRSTEQKIVTDMLHYAYRLDELSKTVAEVQELCIYNEFYGFTRKDLGLYALVNNEIAGALWSRKLNAEHNSQAFIDEQTPVLSMAVLPQFRNKKIGSAMIEQFLLEAGVLYDQLCVSVIQDSEALNFYKKFGFEISPEHNSCSIVDKKPTFTLVKKLEKKELMRPCDGYDVNRWMD